MFEIKQRNPIYGSMFYSKLSQSAISFEFATDSNIHCTKL